MPALNKLDHVRAPLFEGVYHYQLSKPARLHVPGHKGHTFSGTEEEYYRMIHQIDVTEIPGLDDLHDPQEMIAEAQALAADYFGADDTFFLVQGSTVGNLALVLSACQRGDKIIVQRNAHQSIIHGLMLAEAQAVFFHPTAWTKEGIGQLEQMCNIHSDAKAIFVTSPDYYGRTLELNILSRLAHRYQMLLFVDEAHGAHFKLHSKLPSTALDCGADGVVQSTHKMLNSMTMTAMLHLKGERVSKEIVRQQLKMLQTSSPSYPLMASLDLSRRWAALHGVQAVERTLNALQAFRSGMKSKTWFNLESNQDPYKLCIADQTGTLDGFTLQRELLERGCATEMADPYCVIAAYSPAARENDLSALESGLESITQTYQLDERQLIDKNHHASSQVKPHHGNQPWMTAPISFSRTSLNHPWEEVPWAQAHGRYAAEMIVPYPPGVPILFPGERIDHSTLEQFNQWKRAGARFPGLNGRNLDRIRVWRVKKK